MYLLLYHRRYYYVYYLHHAVPIDESIQCFSIDMRYLSIDGYKIYLVLSLSFPLILSISDWLHVNSIESWRIVIVYIHCFLSISFSLIAAAAGYRMMQPNMTWGMQAATAAAAAAAAVPGMPNGNTPQPPMMYTTMPQYQAQ